MVAAANSIQTAKPATSSATANAGTDAKSASGAQDDFTQLLNSLLGNDDKSSATTTVATDAKDAKLKDQSDSEITDAQDPRQWLLMPAPVTPSTPAVAQGGDEDNDGMDSLGSVGNVNANALLAQSLRRLGNAKTDSNAMSGDQQSGEAVSATSGDASSSQSLLDTMLKQPADNFTKTLSLALSDKNGSGSASTNSGSADGTAKLPDTFQAIATQMNNTNVATDTSAQYQIHSRVGSHEWTRDVGDHLTMMVSSKVHSASLQLTPDNLGPVQVKIDVNDNQASVWFTADHPDTRTALEQSLPRLRELFASQGMSLMDAGVFSQQSSQQPPTFTPSSSQASASGITDMSNEATTTQQVLRIGLLDTYA